MEELTIHTSVIDYLGEVNGGVSISISLTLYDYSFEAIYWIHPDKYHTLEIDPKFLKLFGVEKTEDLGFLKEMIEDIDKTIPDREEIFKEFLNDDGEGEGE